jgi:hypothetical protein
VENTREPSPPSSRSGAANDGDGDLPNPLQMAKYAADIFKKLSEQFGANSLGYHKRIYNLGALAFRIAESFFQRPDEYYHFKNEGFWSTFYQKPKDNNIMRSVLYFITGTTSEADHTPAIKLTKVLEQFRREGVDHKDVARLIKERGGVVKIYCSLCPAGAKGQVERDDLDLLKAAPPKRPGETPDAITEEPLDAPEGAPPPSFADDRAGDSVGAPMSDENFKTADHGPPEPIATLQATGEWDEVVGGENPNGGKPGPLNRIDLDSELSIDMRRCGMRRRKIDEVRAAKWVTINAKVEPADDRGWVRVVACLVITSNDTEPPWLDGLDADPPA